MLRKTKTQNSLNLFTMPEEPDRVASTKQAKSDNVKQIVNSFTTTKQQSISESFFGRDNLTKSTDIAETISKAMDNEKRSSKEHLSELSEQQKSRNLKGFNPMTSNGSSILSANTGGITDIGGSQSQIKMPISNSIFDPFRNSRESDKIDNKTATKIEKEQISINRRTAEQSRMNELVEKLRDTDQSKSSSVFRTGTGDKESTEFKKSNNNMSIFDSNDFERVPEKTGGEKISEQVADKKAQKDESWKNNGKSLKSSDVTKKFFDSLIDGLG